MYLICMHLQLSSDQPKRRMTSNGLTAPTSEQHDWWKHTSNGTWGANESLKMGKQQVAGRMPPQMRDLGWEQCHLLNYFTSGFHSVDAFPDYAEANAVQLCSWKRKRRRVKLLAMQIHLLGTRPDQPRMRMTQVHSVLEHPFHVSHWRGWWN